MRLIVPVAITSDIIASTNITEDDHPVWASGTTYVDGDLVIYEHNRYESLINSNTGNQPDTSLNEWLLLGATNRFRPFDEKLSDKCSNPEIITYTFNNNSTNIDGVALFNLVGSTVRVEVIDGTDGTVYDQTKTIIDTSGVSNYFEYFFSVTDVQKFEIIFGDMPFYPNAQTRVTVIANPGVNAEVGQIVLGTVSNLGLTVYNSTLSIEDYSRKDRDAFGNPIIVERAFANLVEFDVKIDTNKARYVQKTLSDRRAKPTVYFASEDTKFGATVYGYFRRFDITISTPSLSEATIEVEGLV